MDEKKRTTKRTGQRPVTRAKKKTVYDWRREKARPTQLLSRDLRGPPSGDKEIICKALENPKFESKNSKRPKT